MNDKIKQLAEEAGFVFWADEPWGPQSATPSDCIDWASNYDDAFIKYTDMIIQMCADHIMESSDRYRKEYFAQKLMELKIGKLKYASS